MALALAFLLIGPSRCLLALAACEVSLVLATALIFGGAGLIERDGDRLAAALDLAALAGAAAFQFAVRIFVHDPSHRLALGGRRLGSHALPPCENLFLRTPAHRLGCGHG